jgi:hypothetical protein
MPIAADADVIAASGDRRPIPDSVDLAEYFFDHGFTDGLPVVPPTPEKVLLV